MKKKVNQNFDFSVNLDSKWSTVDFIFSSHSSRFNCSFRFVIHLPCFILYKILTLPNSQVVHSSMSHLFCTHIYEQISITNCLLQCLIFQYKKVE